MGFLGVPLPTPSGFLLSTQQYSLPLSLECTSFVPCCCWPPQEPSKRFKLKMASGNIVEQALTYCRNAQEEAGQICQVPLQSRYGTHGNHGLTATTLGARAREQLLQTCPKWLDRLKKLIEGGVDVAVAAAVILAHCRPGAVKPGNGIIGNATMNGNQIMKCSEAECEIAPCPSGISTMIIIQGQFHNYYKQGQGGLGTTTIAYFVSINLIGISHTWTCWGPALVKCFPCEREWRWIHGTCFPPQRCGQVPSCLCGHQPFQSCNRCCTGHSSWYNQHSYSDWNHPGEGGDKVVDC